MSQTQRIGKTATKIQYDGDITRVIYHTTSVVVFSAIEVHLNSNGWRTATTKLRMNQTSRQFDLGFSVFQTKGEWFVSYRGKIRDFSDNMILSR